MKIAIPTRESVVDDHFGHCAYYTVYTIEQGQITLRETLPSPQGCGCKSNIASQLQSMGVTLMLAGNMGEGAKNKLDECGIAVIRGCKGRADEVVRAYLTGALEDSSVGCAAHEQGHTCSHGGR